ncbi:MAG: prephenate dehydrogenase [Clostridia bacterium]|nr:prephenate dehydrogenase [Clostridia bacterium]MBP5270104.1 prephenate dehydrogenase [Clostridia bacterium]
MTVGVVGLGLIGGSFARAYSAAGHRVLGYDKDERTLGFASLSGAIAGKLDDAAIPECDLILVCLYRSAAEDYVTAHGPVFGTRPVVVDCCGTKRLICRTGFEAAEKYGFRYFGGHPMAGTQYSGFKYSKANLFSGATMIIVPPDREDIETLSHVCDLLRPAGFAKFTVSDAETHDRVVAFTSQLAHVISAAYVKSDSSALRKGYSAGSYRDMTRVAYMNPDMWTELFLDDGDNLVCEIDALIGHLSEFRDAVAARDPERLKELITESKKKKEEADR